MIDSFKPVASSLLLVAAFSAACVIKSDPPPSHEVVGVPSATAPNGSGGPLLVDVDTDKTMNASGGQGVGVFVEYASGGHWHVFWTCDTTVNHVGPGTCDFAITVDVGQGKLALRADAPTGSAALAASQQQLVVHTTTGVETHGVDFDTDPGVPITVDAAIGGQRDGRYFFFVQNGQINGGYAGTLTDPLMLQGTKP